VNAKIIQVRRDREAALLPPTQGILQWGDPRVSLPKAPGSGPEIGEFVTYLHPETDQVLEFTVLDFRLGKQGGIWYTVAYFGDDEAEVELGVLKRRVPVELGEMPEI